MKKHLIAFILVITMLLSMPLTVMGEVSSRDSLPPCEPQIICSMFMTARGGPGGGGGGGSPPCCDDYF